MVSAILLVKNPDSILSEIFSFVASFIVEFELIIDRSTIYSGLLRLQLILQWTTGLFVLVCCFIERKRFSADIATNLGSSFSLVPFVLVVVRADKKKKNKNLKFLFIELPFILFLFAGIVYSSGDDRDITARPALLLPHPPDKEGMNK